MPSQLVCLLDDALDAALLSLSGQSWSPKIRVLSMSSLSFVSPPPFFPSALHFRLAPKNTAGSALRMMLPSQDPAIGHSTTFEPVTIHRLQRRSRSHTDSTTHSHVSSHVEHQPNPPNGSDIRHAPDHSVSHNLSAMTPPTPRDSLDAMECDLEQGRAAEKTPRLSWGARAIELRGCATSINKHHMSRDG